MSTATIPVAKEEKEIQTFRFVDYTVYQESKKWLQEIFSLKGIIEANTDLWFQLKSQATALVMNIAAASTKLPNDAVWYLGNAITATNKVVACLDIACDLQAMSPQEFQNLRDGFKGIVIQLKSFIRALGTRRITKAAVAA